MVNASNAGTVSVRKPGSRTALVCATLAAAALGILVLQYGNVRSDPEARRQNAHAGSGGLALPADAATRASDVFRAAAQSVQSAADAAVPAPGAATPDLPDAIASIQAAASNRQLPSSAAQAGAASIATAPAPDALPPSRLDTIASIQAAAKSQALSSPAVLSSAPMSEALPLGESIKAAQYISSRQQLEISTANPFLTLPREPFPGPRALP
jgi:hypothetical protein